MWSQTILVICLMRFGCSLVVECMLEYSCWLVVWNPLFLDPSNGVLVRVDRVWSFDLAALLRLPHLKFLFVCHTNPSSG